MPGTLVSNCGDRLRKASRAGLDRVDGIAWSGVRERAYGFLDAAIPTADHEDMLVIIFARIIQLVLDLGKLGALATQQIGIALRADGQDHRLGLDGLAAGQG